MDNCYDESICGESVNKSTPIARCTYCGRGIFEPSEAMVINTNKCTIHIDCWEDYAADNYEEFLSEFYG